MIYARLALQNDVDVEKSIVLGCHIENIKEE